MVLPSSIRESLQNVLFLGFQKREEKNKHSDLILLKLTDMRNNIFSVQYYQAILSDDIF